MASAHVGVREAVTALASRQVHATSCAMFENVAAHMVLAEWPWAFASAEATLVDGRPEETVTQFSVANDAALVPAPWYTIATPESMVLGDAFLFTGTVEGYSLTDIEFTLGVDGLLHDGVNAYDYIEALIGSPAHVNADVVTITAGVAQKLRVSERYEYQYALPTDYSNAKYIYNSIYSARPENSQIPYDLSDDGNGGDVLLCDLDEVILSYTKLPASYTNWSPTALLALSYKLAELIAFAVTRDQEIEDKVAKQYQKALNSAIEKDANSQRPDPDPRGETVRVAWSGNSERW